jgi:hypothetical protein
MPMISVPKEDWCRCQNWRNGHQFLANHGKMKFCGFCGAPLVKVKEEDADDERRQCVIPRQGYYYIAKLANPIRYTVFHIVKDGARQFLCGMDKPTGASPPPDIPKIERCCRACLAKLRKIPVRPGDPGTKDL